MADLELIVGRWTPTSDPASVLQLRISLASARRAGGDAWFSEWSAASPTGALKMGLPDGINCAIIRYQLIL